MPTPGVARNPLRETPDRFRRTRQVFVPKSGQTPGLQDVDLRFDAAAAGTIRRLYRQAINLILPAPEISWSYNNGQGEITRAARYKASSVYSQAGSSNTRFGAPRPMVAARHNRRPVTLGAGNRQSRPTVRNRLTSFGKRVPPTNQPSPAAEGAQSS